MSFASSECLRIKDLVIPHPTLEPEEVAEAERMWLID